MNINEYKKHLQHIHGTLDDESENKQRDIKETHVNDMSEFKPDEKKNKSTVQPTTKAGKTLRPNSKSGKNLEEGNEFDDTLEMALEYFEGYFGDSLNESISGEDVMEAVYDLIDLTESVLNVVGIEEEDAPMLTRHTKKQHASRTREQEEIDAEKKRAGDRPTEFTSSGAPLSNTNIKNTPLRYRGV